MTSTAKSVSFHIIGDAFVDFLCFLQDSLPESGGDALLTSSVQQAPGGSASNSATHLSSLLRSSRVDMTTTTTTTTNENEMTSVRFYTAINPQDESGRLLLRHAEQSGFPLINCVPKDDGGSLCRAATGQCVVMVTGNERSFMTHQGCMDDFHATALPLDRMVGTKPSKEPIHVHVSGYFNIPGFWDGALLERLQQLRRERQESTTMAGGPTTILSLVPQFDASGQWDHGLLDLLSVLDLLIVNDLEAARIAGLELPNEQDQNDHVEMDSSTNVLPNSGVVTTETTADSDSSGFLSRAAVFFHEKSPRLSVVVTLGKDGAAVLRDGRVLVRQRATVVTPVDPTGAGDAFVAGFLYGLWNNQPSNNNSNDDSSPTSKLFDVQERFSLESIRHGLLFGCAVATSSVLVRGASVSSPRELIDQMVEKTKAAGSL